MKQNDELQEQSQQGGALINIKENYKLSFLNLDIKSVSKKNTISI